MSEVNSRIGAHFMDFLNLMLQSIYVGYVLGSADRSIIRTKQCVPLSIPSENSSFTRPADDQLNQLSRRSRVSLFSRIDVSFVKKIESPNDSRRVNIREATRRGRE